MTDKTNAKAVQANVRNGMRYLSGLLLGSAGLIAMINPAAGAAAGGIGQILQHPEVVAGVGALSGGLAEIWFRMASK